MGGSSSHEYGKIHIVTKKDAYKAGETIAGEVYVKMEKPCPQGGTLMLKFKGWEKTKWSENLFDQIGLNVFYRNSVQLYNWSHGTTIDCECYTFPFTLKTEPKIPGTFNFKGPDGECGEIRYTLKAEIIMHSSQIPKLKNHTQVVIRENYDDYKEALYKETSLSCVTCYCLNQGTSKLGCQFEQYVYVSGETADLLVAVDNSTCSLPVESIEAKFIQTITLKDNKGKVKELSKTLLKQDFGRVEPYTRQVGPSSNKIALPLIAKDSNKPFEPSTSGDIIVCKYDLKVKCQMNGSCLQAEPNVKSNVFLYPTALADFGKIQPPPGFAPKIMKSYDFALSAENQYANKDGSKVILRGATRGFGVQTITPQPKPIMHNQVLPLSPQNQEQKPFLNQQLQPATMMQQPILPLQQNFPINQESQSTTIQQQEPIVQQQPPILQPQQPMLQQQQPIFQQEQPMVQQNLPINQESQSTTIQQQEQPIVQQQEPIVQQQPPILQPQQPMLQQQQPIVQQQQPMAQQQQPILQQQQPMAMQQQQPMVMQQQQPMRMQQPMMMQQQQPNMMMQQQKPPMMMQQQPMMMQQQPMMMQQQPMMMQQQPMRMQQQPMMMQQQPMMMQQKPMMVQPQPLMMQQPMVYQQQPMMNPMFVNRQQPMMQPQTYIQH